MDVKLMDQIWEVQTEQSIEDTEFAVINNSMLVKKLDALIKKAEEEEVSVREINQALETKRTIEMHIVQFTTEIKILKNLLKAKREENGDSKSTESVV